MKINNKKYQESVNVTDRDMKDFKENWKEEMGWDKDWTDQCFPDDSYDELEAEWEGLDEMEVRSDVGEYIENRAKNSLSKI